MEILLCKDKAKLLSIEAFSVYSSCMYKPTFDKYKSKMELLIANTSVKIFLYEVNSKIVGMLVLNNAESYPEIVGIAVHEDFRRCGIGKKLIQEVMLSEHLKSVTAQTDDDAIDFYRKCGFTDERIISESTFGRMIRYNCSLVK